MQALSHCGERRQTVGKIDGHQGFNGRTGTGWPPFRGDQVINDAIQDTCCPLKILKSSYAREIPFFIGMHRFLPALVQLHGGKVKQLPISHSPRYAGTSKYHLLNRLVGPFFDTLAFRWMRSRYIRYKIAD